MTGLTIMCGYAVVFFAVAAYMDKKLESK